MYQCKNSGVFAWYEKQQKKGQQFGVLTRVGGWGGNAQNASSYLIISYQSI